MDIREISARRVPLGRVVLREVSRPTVYGRLVLRPAPGITCLRGGVQPLEAMRDLGILNHRCFQHLDGVPRFNLSWGVAVNRKGFQMASCGEDVVHWVGKLTLRFPESGNVIHNWLNRRVRRLARSTPSSGSRPGSSRSIEQAGRGEIRGQSTLVPPLMDGVRCALVSPVVSI